MCIITIPPPSWSDVLQTAQHQDILRTYLERMLGILPDNTGYSTYFSALEKSTMQTAHSYKMPV